MNVLKIALSSLLLLSQSALAAEFCTVSGERIKSVKFPGGRELLIVGHNHGDREIPFALNRLLAKQASNDEFEQELGKIHAQIRMAANQSKEDVALLLEQLKSRRDLKFVGFESTNAVALNNFKNYALLYDAYEKSISNRGIPRSEIQDDVIRVALGPISYLYAHEPAAFAGREILGFESEQAIADADEAEKLADAARIELDKLAAGDREFLGNISSTDFQLWNAFDAFVPEKDSARFRASIASAAIPAAYFELTMKWVDARLLEMTTLKNREAGVAVNILATNQSGILFMGQKHLEGLMPRLLEACNRSQIAELSN